MLFKDIKGSTISVDFELPKHNIFYIVNSTNQEERVNAINGEIRLIKNRIYYIPIDNKEINSDNCNQIKVFSKMADKINIVFVKDGYACVIPIVHNTSLRNKQHICNVV
jgi:hypothetical protein